MLGVHSILARIYYNLNSLELQTAADIAVRAGGQYLPGNPHAAMSIADAYLRRYGVAPDEIVFTGTTPDDLTLTIRLRRRMPWYMAALAINLPSRIITVTATEQLRRDRLQSASSVRLPVRVFWRVFLYCSSA
jgi:hypothetical protein